MTEEQHKQGSPIINDIHHYERISKKLSGPLKYLTIEPETGDKEYLRIDDFDGALDHIVELLNEIVQEKITDLKYQLEKI